MGGVKSVFKKHRVNDASGRKYTLECNKGPELDRRDFFRFLTKEAGARMTVIPPGPEDPFTIRRLASDHVDSLPVHPELALPGPPTFPFLASLLLLLFALLACFLAS